MKVTNRLESCPFCGGMAATYRTTEHGTFIEVNHLKGCAIETIEQPDYYFEDLEEAIKAWNARSPEPTEILKNYEQAMRDIAGYNDIDGNSPACSNFDEAQRIAIKALAAFNGEAEKHDPRIDSPCADWRK